MILILDQWTIAKDLQEASDSPEMNIYALFQYTFKLNQRQMPLEDSWSKLLGVFNPVPRGSKTNLLHQIREGPSLRNWWSTQ